MRIPFKWYLDQRILTKLKFDLCESSFWASYIQLLEVLPTNGCFCIQLLDVHPTVGIHPIDGLWLWLTIQIPLWLLLEIILIHNTNCMKEKTIFMDTFKLSTFLGPTSALNQLDQSWNLQAISDFSWVGFSISIHGYQLFQPKTTRVTGTKNGW